LARKRRTTWGELASFDFIGVSQRSGNRLLVDQALAGVAVRPQAVFEADHVSTLLGMVEAGLGVAAVPSLAMPGKDHPLLVSVPLEEPIVTRHVGLIRRSGRALTPAAQQLFDVFSEIKRTARSTPKAA
jgi:DNA-binding transcriptional LysR family regulator